MARSVSSALLTASSGPIGYVGDGAPIELVGLPTSSVPDSLLELRLATATVCDASEPSAAMTMSELGAAPMATGARSSCTVVATAAAPIGTTLKVRSSTLPVTAYSPARGRGAWSPKACWFGLGVGAGAAGCAGGVGAPEAAAAFAGGVCVGVSAPVTASAPVVLVGDAAG